MRRERKKMIKNNKEVEDEYTGSCSRRRRNRKRGMTCSIRKTKRRRTKKRRRKWSKIRKGRQIRKRRMRRKMKTSRTATTGEV